MRWPVGYECWCILACVLGVSSACTGLVGDGGGVPASGSPAASDPKADPNDPLNLPKDPQLANLPGAELAASNAFRRLTADEYESTLRDLVGDTSRSAHLVLPEDVRGPFDNDFSKQKVSAALVQGVELAARDASTALLADTARRDQIVGCRPSGPADAACLKDFVTRFGRRALRRPLGKTEIDSYLQLQSLAMAEGSFYAAVDAVVRALLQDPELIYRVEIGTPVRGQPDLFALTDWEIGARLSYFMWGTTPSDELLDLAARGVLSTPEQRRAAATQMLADPRARERIQRFHAMWLGYETISVPAALASAMKVETDALISRVLFEDKRPWHDLLRSRETFVSDILVRHYGIAGPVAPSDPLTPTWVPYGTSQRRGLLSHGSFLASAGTTDELLLTIRRGKGIQERLFCIDVPPKPENVDTSAKQAPASHCKVDVLAAHEQGGCAACHKLMDAVGFGLENFGPDGQYRSSLTMKDPMTGTQTTCPAKAGGLINDQKFAGPAELENLILKAPGLNSCLIKQLHRFTFGRFKLTDVDAQFVDLVSQRVGAGDFRFDQLILDFVSSSAFAHRRVEK